MSDSGPVSGWGERIGQARSHAGLSREEAAEAVGISVRSWLKYEVEAAAPNRPVNLLIASRCGVDPGWLWTGETD